MILNVTLKMIVRSWWRNKVFFLVSVASLALGLACTNLLMTYLYTNMGWKEITLTVTASFSCNRMIR